MDGKKIKKLVIALILVILAGLAYLFLLRYSDKQKEAESQKEQEEAAASVVFETDTDEVSSISFSGDDGILTFEKKNDTWICPDDSVFQMNENKIQKLLADISSVSCTRELDARGDLAQFRLKNRQIRFRYHFLTEQRRICISEIRIRPRMNCTSRQKKNQIRFI